MNSKELYYRDHPCPSWADEKQWAKLLEKVVFMPEGGISFEKLSFNEAKILDGFSFSAMLEQRSIHKDERATLLKLQKFSGRKEGALGEEAKILEKLIVEYPSLSSKELRKIAEEESPTLFKDMSGSTFDSKISRLRNK